MNLFKYGRSYTFALLSLFLGFSLCVFHRVDGASFVALVLGLATVVAGRAVGEDILFPKALLNPASNVSYNMSYGVAAAPAVNVKEVKAKENK